MNTIPESEMNSIDYDVVIVGAGFAGLYMLYQMKKIGLSARVFEGGDDVGGTWFWNRYPGARCDVPSMQYSYQFDEELQQEWEWPERYSAQPDILKYIDHVANKFNLKKDIEFNSWVTAAEYVADKKAWRIKTESQSITSRFCVMATGCLSATNTPDLSGLEKYSGKLLHTGKWPKENIDFTGKTVGIIGTGSSAIQSIPLIAKEAKHLYVFQRTPNYSVPAANTPTDLDEEKEIKSRYAEFRAECASRVTGYEMYLNEKSALSVGEDELKTEYEQRWANGGLMFLGGFSDILTDPAANETAAQFIREKISNIVTDPEVAKILMPEHKVGCKRLCADTGYYETFNRSNVSLIDVSTDPIKEITNRGLITHESEFEFENLVMATGFDAMTGAIIKVDITGINGITLREQWTEEPTAYLGLSTHNFPNLFTVTGPGSPSVLTNMIPSIEQHVNWITDCITWLDQNGYQSIEADASAESDWAKHVNEVADATIFPTCNSWYLGANIPGKTRTFLPYLGFPAYVEKCNSVVKNNYEGFHCR